MGTAACGVCSLTAESGKEGAATGAASWKLLSRCVGLASVCRPVACCTRACCDTNTQLRRRNGFCKQRSLQVAGPLEFQQMGPA